MITTLTILSLDQGRIYSPPPEPVREQTVTENEALMPTPARVHGTSHDLRRLNLLSGLHAVARLLTPTFGSTPAGKAQ